MNTGTVIVCPDRDIECGNNPLSWCASCPKVRTKKKVSVSELPAAILQQASNILRCIADEIDSGDYGKVEMAAIVIINSEGKLETFGAAGAIDCYRAIALFDMARASLVKKMDVGPIE